MNDFLKGRIDEPRCRKRLTIHSQDDRGLHAPSTVTWDNKARAAVDAMERGMGTKIATESVLQILRQALKLIQPLAGADHAGGAGERCQAGRHPDARGAPPGDELGTTGL